MSPGKPRMKSTLDFEVLLSYSYLTTYSGAED